MASSTAPTITLPTELRRFGRYIVLGKIGSGGMADVQLALLVSPGGAERLVVIKTLLPELADEPSSAAMFMDEARALSALAHPSLLQIHDSGFHDEEPFIVVEYLDGLTLSELAVACHERELLPPVSVVVRIISEVAAGLAHAHAARTLDGTPLDLVHRDVSPSNVMVLRNGTAKLIDFGVAKTARNFVTTEIGSVKGKPRFVAPELISGERPTAAADVWALGVLLWETLTQRRLFRGRGFIEVMTHVKTGPIPPPSTHAPKVDRVLDAIVASALDRDPRARCTMEALHHALARWLVSRTPHVGASEVSGFLRDIGRAQLAERDVRIRDWLRHVEAARPSRELPADRITLTGRSNATPDPRPVVPPTSKDARMKSSPPPTTRPLTSPPAQRSDAPSGRSRSAAASSSSTEPSSRSAREASGPRRVRRTSPSPARRSALAPASAAKPISAPPPRGAAKPTSAPPAPRGAAKPIGAPPPPIPTTSTPPPPPRSATKPASTPPPPPRSATKPTSTPPPPPRGATKPTSAPPPPRVATKPISAPPPPCVATKPISAPPPPRVATKPISAPPPPRVATKPISAPPPPCVATKPISAPPPPCVATKPPTTATKPSTTQPPRVATKPVRAPAAVPSLAADTRHPTSAPPAHEPRARTATAAPITTLPPPVLPNRPPAPLPAPPASIRNIAVPPPAPRASDPHAGLDPRCEHAAVCEADEHFEDALLGRLPMTQRLAWLARSTKRLVEVVKPAERLQQLARPLREHRKSALAGVGLGVGVAALLSIATLGGDPSSDAKHGRSAMAVANAANVLTSLAPTQSAPGQLGPHTELESEVGEVGGSDSSGHVVALSDADDLFARADFADHDVAALDLADRDVVDEAPMGRSVEATEVAFADEAPPEASTDDLPAPPDPEAVTDDAPEAIEAPAPRTPRRVRPRTRRAPTYRAPPRVAQPAPPVAVATRTQPESTLESTLNRARERFRQGDYEGAAHAYKNASRLAPRNPLVFAGLGAARMRAGDRRGAMDAYERAVALAPSNSHYRTTLARLQ